MRVVSLDIPDVKLLTPRIVWDDRGFFSETYRRTVLAETGVEAEVVYKVTDYYAQVCERGLRWDDPALGIAWPVAADRARLSDRDRRYPGMSELPAYFHVRR